MTLAQIFHGIISHQINKGHPENATFELTLGFGFFNCVGGCRYLKTKYDDWSI